MLGHLIVIRIVGRVPMRDVLFTVDGNGSGAGPEKISWGRSRYPLAANYRLLFTGFPSSALLDL